MLCIALFFAKVSQKPNLSNNNEMLKKCKYFGNYFSIKSFLFTFAKKLQH